MCKSDHHPAWEKQHLGVGTPSTLDVMSWTVVVDTAKGKMHHMCWYCSVAGEEPGALFL